MVLSVIVTYNGEKYIEDCLDSLRNQTSKTDILLVDNASSDHTINIVKNGYPEVKILELEHNSGFAHGNNVGIRYALEHQYEYVLLLNEDTISDSKLVEVMLKEADSNTAVIPKIYMDAALTKVWYAAGKMDFEQRIAINCQKEFVDVPMEVSFMTGCCMLIHTDIWRKVGMFDEDFFMYYEDTDLSLRMHKNNIHMMYTPNTYIWHRIQGKKEKHYYVYYMERNKLYFFRKHKEVFRYPFLKMIMDEIISIFLCADVYSVVFRKYKVQGLIDFIRNRMGKKVFT